MYVFMYVCMYVGLHVCTYIYIYIYIYVTGPSGAGSRDGPEHQGLKQDVAAQYMLYMCVRMHSIHVTMHSYNYYHDTFCMSAHHYIVVLLSHVIMSFSTYTDLTTCCVVLYFSVSLAEGW